MDLDFALVSLEYNLRIVSKIPLPLYHDYIYPRNSQKENIYYVMKKLLKYKDQNLNDQISNNFQLNTSIIMSKEYL